MGIRSVSFDRVQQANKPKLYPCLSHSSDFQGLTTSRGFKRSARGGRHFGVANSARLRSRDPGDVAQLGEHLLCKQGVSGSNPLISTSTLTTE